jgi:hypothetical protein
VEGAARADLVTPEGTKDLHKIDISHKTEHSYKIHPFGGGARGFCTMRMEVQFFKKCKEATP